MSERFTTIQNTPPLVTSNKARAKHNLSLLADPDGAPARFDVLRPQRLAAPVTVYVEQFSAHPLEADAAELYGPPDGYVDSAGRVHKERQSAGEIAVPFSPTFDRSISSSRANGPKASSRSGWTPATARASAGSGSRPSASIGKNLWSSAGPILRGAVRSSARCCWGITVLTGGSSTPAGSAPECGQISSRIYGSGFNRCRPTRCRSTSRRRALPVSARLWCCRGFIGSAGARRRGQVSDLDR
jgi:hypothetical protein